MDNPGDRKTDYFTTFLGALSSGVTAVSSGVSQAFGGAPPDAGDVRDDLIRALAAHGGASSIGDLLGPPFTSLGQLISAAQELQTVGLARIESGSVHLSDQGLVVARKLGAASPASSV